MLNVRLELGPNALELWKIGAAQKGKGRKCGWFPYLT